jgi:Rrf2 family protein
MMLSKKAKYALHACLGLARAPIGQTVLIADLARQERVPKKFLEIILLELRNAGLLASRKGKGGGYSLARPARQITVGQIVRIIDGPLAPVPCVSQTAYSRCEECLDENSCGLRMVMKDARDALAGVLDAATLESVIEREDGARTLGRGGGDWVI